MDLNVAMQVAFAGLGAQSERLKVISENLANADSTSQTPGGTPYQRKLITFRSVFDRSIDATTVKTGDILNAGGTFQRRLDPANPGADADGYVQLPNVNPLVELMDMKDAQQTYQANLNVIDAAKAMISHTLDLMRS